jgi:hypothetical protein
MLKRDISVRIAIALIATIIIVYFYPHHQSSRYNYEEGRPWNYAKLIAPFDIPIHPDSLTLRKAKDTLEARFVPVYELNQLVVDTVIKSLPKVAGTDYASRLGSHLRKAYAGGVVDEETKDRIDKGTLPKVRILEKNILSEMSTADFMSPREVYLYLDSTVTDPILRRYMSTVKLAELIRPSVVYNEEESKRHYEYDYLTLTADRGVIQQGQTIVDKGTIITPQDYTNLQTYEQMIEAQLTKETQSNIVMIIGQFIYVALLLAALVLYLHAYAHDIYSNRRALIFVFLLVTLFFLFASCINSFTSTGVYLVPMTIVPVLILVFFDPRTALFTAIIQTLICAPITTFPLEFIFLQFCAACAAVYSLKELSRRSQLLRTAAFVAGAHIVAYFSLELLLNGTLEGFVWMMPVALLINAILVSMTYILMFVVERVFGFTSQVTLIELADINNPLLRQLSNDCPGTFQHCISVSNLAADAAARIDANEQLVRTGALYHDIGKLSNPAFFTENQHGVNPHDALPPEKSAEIVIRHVTDGLRRADKAGLPAVIKDFIREHHGAGQAKYFYYNYCKQHPEEQHIDPKPFTYPGPNPRSRETSLLMMADAVEAASRSLPEYTNEAIIALVNRIVDGQIADGLHNNSTLAYRDVSLIKETFIKRLMTMYHSRVAYPTAPENSTPVQPSAQ